MPFVSTEPPRRPIARVLVCGGRDYANPAHVERVLGGYHAASPIECLIEGGARGADTLARNWARRNGVPFETYRADWAMHGPAAGPIRNQRMLEEGKPDLVIAFPGGRGTADMLCRAKAAGVSTVSCWITPPPGVPTHARD